MKQIVLVFSTLFLLTACGGDGKNGAASDYNLLDETPAVTLVSIQVTPAKITVPKGTTGEYTALAYYSDDSSKDVSSIVQWTSTDTAVVAFTSSVPNHAEALAAGTSTIFATLDGVKSNSATVEVTNATLDHIQLTPITKSVPKGIFVQYQAIGYYNDSTFYDLTPYATFSSSDASVAIIQSGGSIPGLAKTLRIGSTVMTATFDGQTSNVAVLNVTPALLSTIQITPADTSVPKGTTGSYIAIAYYDDGTSHDITKQAAWQSADTNIVSIISSGINAGYAEALNVGSTTVTAIFEGKTSNSAKVEVTNATLESIQLSPASKTVSKGIFVQYKVTGYYSDSTFKDLTPYATLKSSDLSVATIQSGGSIPALADTIGVGSTNITATFDGQTSNTAVLKVTPALLSTIQITPADTSVPKGTTGSYIAIAYYDDGTSHDITKQAAWQSADTNIVSIISSGVNAGYAEALNVGSTTVTATFEGKTSNVATVVVRDAVLKSIKITPETISVPEGVKVDYIAVGTYSDGTIHDISNSASWKSSDTGIATVISTDISKATFSTHGVGTALITVNAGSVTSNEAVLTVTKKEVFSLLITPAQDQEMAKGTKTQLTVTATYTTGLSIDVTHDATWFSNDPSVASVESGTNGGLVTANSSGGPVDITAVYEGITSNIKKITVVDNAPRAIVSYEGCIDGGDGYWHHSLLGSASTGNNLTYKWTIPADGSLDDADRAYIDDTVADAVLKVRKGAHGIDVSKIVAQLTVSNSAGESSALVIPYFPAACP